MILIDTGPIVALFDNEDDYHAACHASLKTITSPLITTMPVLTEAFYLLNFSWPIQDDLWGFVTQGNLHIYNFDRMLLLAALKKSRIWRRWFGTSEGLGAEGRQTVLIEAS